MAQSSERVTDGNPAFGRVVVFRRGVRDRPAERGPEVRAGR
jgi:hypothetical protein